VAPGKLTVISAPGAGQLARLPMSSILALSSGRRGGIHDSIAGCVVAGEVNSDAAPGLAWHLS
jgi:uncharacterized RDD family membrane protein YckC